MIVSISRWSRLNISLDQFDGIAHDSTLLVEFALQDGETKIPVNSTKFLYNGELHETKDGDAIPYCIHVIGIESITVSSEQGHPEIYVTGLEQTQTEFRIVGMNGSLIFFGQALAVSFLRDDSSFAVVKALEPYCE